MHVGLLVSMAPSPLAPGTLDLELFERLVEVIERRRCPLSIHLGGPVSEHLRSSRPDLIARLRELDVEWVRAGWGGPNFAMIPADTSARQIAAEADALDELSLQPGGMVVRGPWDSSLVTTFADNGIRHLIVDAAHFETPAVGVVDRFDAVLPVIPLVGEIADLPSAGTDELVMVEATPDRLESMLGSDRCRGLTTPGAFLADHGVRRRVTLTSGAWRDAIGRHPETDLLFRKMVRLATRVPERLPAALSREVLAAQYGPSYSPEASPPDRLAAHRALIRARRAIDGTRHRGDGWVRLSRLDWNADGAEEIQLELPDLSTVVAPTIATLVYLDDKTRTWPVSAVDGEGGGAWRLFHQRPEEPTSFEVVGVEEHRGAATVELRSSDGDVGLRLAAEGRVIRLVTTLDAGRNARAGPELKLAFESGVRMRVDGSQWDPVSEPLMRTGHRFRFEDDERQVVIAAMTPVDCEVRPGGSGGVIVWPSWQIGRPGTHELTIEFA